mmetsp:Transcript_3195/g.431  ORF Transcript_3195/g.431 Transcript_3195/m.431 type:complete len:82 (+) Transcript_3195:81-326(+)
MCGIFDSQGRSREVVDILLNFADMIETKFILKQSPQIVKMKKNLSVIYNKYGIERTIDKDFELGKLFLETAETLLNNLIND